MFLRQMFLGIIGISAGLLVSGGVFTVLASVGLAPRFAGKTHTGKKIFLYEEMIVFGTLAGALLSVYRDPLRISWPEGLAGWITGLPGRLAAGVLLCLFGGFAGIFVGCLALAIAEMLDTIPVFARRASFRKGLKAALFSVALGKLAGGLYYFSQGFFGE